MEIMVKFLHRNKFIGSALGALGGYLYYYRYIGCWSGHCPISSNPWISTVYGALIGFLAAPDRRDAVKKSDGLAD